MDCNTQAPLSSTIFRSLLKFMSIELAMLSNHLILCCWLFILPSVFPSIRVFSSLHIRWPKYWVFSISPSNEYSRLISFRIDWFDLLAVQGTLKSVLQHSSLKGLYSWVLSLLYGPTLTSAHAYWKNHSFDSWTLVSKVVSLLFNTLSRFVIAFLPRSKLLLISWLQSPSAVILQTKKIKFISAPTFSPSVCCEVVGSGASQVALVVKNLPASAEDLRDMGSIPGLGKSPGGGHSNPLQYSCLENPMHRGAWWATVHSVAKSWTWLKWLSTHAWDRTGCHDLSIVCVES